MKEVWLKDLPLGSTGYISKCLTPTRIDVYRLLEMGLCRGAQFTVLRKEAVLGAIEIALQGSRLCIATDLAAKFKVVVSQSLVSEASL